MWNERIFARGEIEYNNIKGGKQIMEQEGLNEEDAVGQGRGKAFQKARMETSYYRSFLITDIHIYMGFKWSYPITEGQVPNEKPHASI